MSEAGLIDTGSIEADGSADLGERVRAAAAARAPLRLRGSGSKDFLGHASPGDLLDMSTHSGIVRYAPDELVLTARAGTRMATIDAALAEHGQMLGFEPPHFGANATLGGTLAAGLSGPCRASAGAARDFVLGVRILDGRGDSLRFGGEVMKNVAGYDVSRLMVGAFGTLGVILEASLKLVPKPRMQVGLRLQLDPTSALDHLRRWAQRPLPISASAIVDDALYVRLSGATAAVRAAAAELGGERIDDDAFWLSLREQTHVFFADPRPLWRLSVAAAMAIEDLDGPVLIEWQGAQRWLKSDADPARIRAAASAGGGHATHFRAGAAARAIDQVFHPLPAPMLALHRRLKAEFDPHGLFNRGRLYPEL
ncbi:MAG: glycolate oxidase subunit GlcE [Dokdonella sp.]